MRIALVVMFLVTLALGAVIAAKDAELAELGQLNNAITGELAVTATDLEKAERELHSKTRQLQTAREQLKVANQTIDRLDARLSASRTVEEVVPEKEVEDATPGEKRAEATRGFMKAMGKFLDNPDLRAMRENRQREAFKRQYTALFELLGLDEELDAQVREVLLERQIAMAEFGPKFMALAGDPEKLKALTEEMSGIRDEYDEALEEILGADYSQLEEYETTVHDRGALAQFGKRLEAAGDPLDDASHDAMLQVMSEARRGAELDADWQDPRVLGELMEPGAVDAVLGQVAEMQQAVYARSEEILAEQQRQVLSRQQKMEAGFVKATLGAFAQ